VIFTLRTGMLIISLLTVPNQVTAQQEESTGSAEWRVLTGLSGSVTGANNWRGAEYQSLSFNGYADAVFRNHGSKWTSSHIGHWELGFTRYLDSLWMKHTDLLRFQFMWSKESSVGRTSLSISGRTQLFDSYFYYYDPVQDKTRSQWAGSFFNPADLEAGYGFCKLLGDYGSLNIAFATIRFRHIPAMKGMDYSNAVALTRKGVVDIDYGCSVQAFVMKNFGKSVDWYFNGKCFLNGAGRNGLNMDLLNRVTLKIWKCFQLRLESRVIYDPLFSYRMQYRNELLAGIFADFKHP
jgi:hypothetical protein